MLTTASSATTLSVDDILSVLNGVRKCGDGYIARCPAHMDRQPSLSIGLGDDGSTILLHCHAGCSFDAIRAALPLDGRLTAAEGASAPILAPPPPPEPPSRVWQARADQFVAYAVQQLWTDTGRKALAWLRKRGFRDETLLDARVGYNPRDLHDAGHRWGIDDAPVSFPEGIVIPWQAAGSLWNVEIRRLTGSPKYHSVRGGRKQAMLGLDHLDGKPAVLVEGYFDYLALRQAAADLATPVALGSTATARHVQWLIRLAAAPLVLVSLDADSAGAAAAAWWLGALPNARLWRPDYDDPAAMLAGGADLRAWVQAGLAGPPPPPVDDIDPCVACGGKLHRYLPSGRPSCAAHYDELLADEEAASQASARASDMYVEEERGRESRPALLTIPKRTRQARCASCKAPIYWIVMPSGKMAPVSIDTALHPQCAEPTRDEPGYGINHFINCPSAAAHRAKNKVAA